MIDVFGGRGFVGTHFCSSRNDLDVKARDDYKVTSDKVVYFISTVDNYNVLENPYLDIQTNLITLIDVLKSCKPGTTFNFISSWFVYGDVELPAREDSICDPKGFYSITKRAAEQLLISYCETFKINYRILRLANVVGSGDGKVSKRKNALQYLVDCLKKNEDIKLYYNGDFIRDYIHVKDVVSAINLVIENGDHNSVYNIGNGEPILFSDLISYAASKLNSKSNIGTMEATDFHKTIQVRSMYMDNSKLKKLGYKPSYTKFEMMDDLL